MADKAMYTAEQVATAARTLREAVGAEDQFFPIEDVIAMLSDEILLLRERGFTDERISALLNDLEIKATAEQIDEFYIDPDIWEDGSVLHNVEEEDDE